jgi:ribonucleoside-diphosphate reductase alpha chain
VSATGAAGAVTAFLSGGTKAATALKTEPVVETEADRARAIEASQRAQAKAKGYEGSACPECHNFTMVRNGTCLKCDTCGSTTGCS